MQRPRPASDGAPAWRAAGHLGLVAVVALAAYSNSFAVPFQFDDGLHIVENPAVRSLGAFLGNAPLGARWFGYLTFALNGTLHGLAVGGYHALNLAIHLGAAACLYGLASLAARAAAPEGSAVRLHAPFAGLVAALLFAAHPLQTQAVTYVVQRFASLAALLYAAAVLTHAHGVLGATPRRRLAARVASLALAVLGLLTKENTVTLPAALALYDLSFLPGTWRSRAARLAPALAVTAAVVLLVLKPVQTIVGTIARESALVPGAAAEGVSRVAYLLTQAPVVLRYLGLVALPLGQNVDPDVPLVPSPASGRFLAALAGLVLLLALPAALAWRARARSASARMTLFAVGWLAVTLSVESSVFPLADPMAEHRMYLPSMGIFLLAGWAAASLRARASRDWQVMVPVALVVAALAGATWARNRLWRDPVSLWSDAVQKSPMKPRPYLWLSQALQDRGDLEGALPLVERAVVLPPPLPITFQNLGVLYVKLGRPEDAERAFRRVLAFPGAPWRGANLSLGMLLLDRGRAGEACALFAAELAVYPASLEALENHGTCLLQRGDASGAIEQYGRVLRLQPGNARVLYNAAYALSVSGAEDRAREAWRRFLSAAGPELAPQRADAARWLAAHPPGP
jgi:Flp pilus assembly protein TadD